jgi:WD40 repeat protein
VLILRLLYVLIILLPGQEYGTGRIRETTYLESSIAVGFSPDGKRLLVRTGSAGSKSSKTWDITKRPPTPVSGDFLQSQAAARKGGNEGKLRLHFPDEKRRLEAVDGGAHADAALVVTALENGKELLRLSPTAGLEERRVTFTCACVSPDCRQLLSGGDDDAVRVWDLELGKELHCFEGHEASLSCVCFSPDGSRALTGDKHGAIRIWDITKGKELLCIKTREDAVISRVQSADAQEKFRALQALSEAAVIGLAQSADGQRLLSVQEDGELRLWDCASARQLASFPFHFPFDRRDGLVCLAFSPDGRYALSGGDSTVDLWRLPP